VSVAVAVPVLLGSLLRIPLGVITDRMGARLIFPAVMAAAALPAIALGWIESYAALVALGVPIGIGLSSFAVGVPFVSRWYPPARQGTALGHYGLGTGGQSIAAAGSPLVAAALGYAWGFAGAGLLALGWLVLFVVLARDAPRATPAGPAARPLSALRDRRAAQLSALYFLTFGGFVAMSLYLPLFLTDLFGLEPGDAGLRTAGFVVLATAMRPIGGFAADRYGGRRILLRVFPATAVCALLMACPHIVTFTAGALGMAAAIGLGNGAIFKLVPELFPRSVGAVTGLVGAAGGLGGFFPPLVLGVVREATGSYLGGFLLLALSAIGCFLLARSRSLRPPPPDQGEGKQTGAGAARSAVVPSPS
jgi:NNP family nitrate/nitrite transporter-like MFS transporter